jgi:hypothetical protein
MFGGSPVTVAGDGPRTAGRSSTTLHEVPVVRGQGCSPPGRLSSVAASGRADIAQLHRKGQVSIGCRGQGRSRAEPPTRGLIEPKPRDDWG